MFNSPLSTQPSARPSTRRIGPKRARELQRIAHLVAGAALVLYVYFTPGPGSAVETAMRWLVLPALVGSGLVMWQWPRLRRRMRRGRLAA